MKALLAKIRAILRDRKTRRLWTRIISATACLVVFVSTYALILPAITMEREAACGMEAHQHSDECYEEMLTCGLEESEEHQHTEACYEQVLVCGKEPHIHSEACYRQDSTTAAAAEGTSVPVDNAQGDTQNGSQAGAQNSEPDDTQAGAQGEAGNDTQTDTQNGAQDDAQIIVPDQAGLPSDSVEIDITDGQENAGMVDMETDFRDGTLTADGDGYHITLDYTAKAQIPETASLSVKEITPDTDPEAYETCLQQAAEKMAAGAGSADAAKKSDIAGRPANAGADTVGGSENPGSADAAGGSGAPTIDTAASRFFDIEIVVADEEGDLVKIEPMAPVAVSIRLSNATKEAGISGAADPADAADAADRAGTAGAADAADTPYVPADNGIDASGAVSVVESDAGSGSPDSDQNSDGNSDRNSDPTVLHFAEDGVEKINSMIDSVIVEPASDTGDSARTENATAISFEAESFSIYGVVYTVDYHWEVNGSVYDFSIPGGGFVSFEHLVEALGIGTGDSSSHSDAGNGTETRENDPDDGSENAGEAQETSGTYDEAIRLNERGVSEAARRFVAEVASLEFSDSELIWAGKTDEAATVGGLKEANGLETEYSAELTEDQIAEINAQTVEAGDWALISVHPFTSEETLTVTMKNGEQFVVRVTDAQISKTFITAEGDTYRVTVTYDENAGIPADAELTVSEIREGEEYEGLTDQARQLLDAPSFSFLRIFDIGITVDGEKVEPAGDVRVMIEYIDGNQPEEGTGISVIHFAENGPEILSASADTSDEGVMEVSFYTENFSPFVTVSERINNSAITESVIAFFNFDEIDERGGFTSTVNGITAYATPIVTGAEPDLSPAYDGNVLKLDNSNDDALKVEKSDGSRLMNGLTQATISYWEYTTDNGPSWAYYAAPNDRPQESPNECYIGAVHKNDQLTVERYYNGRGGGDYNITTGAGSGEWHYVTVVYGTNTTTVYVDGEQKQTKYNQPALKNILGNQSIFQIGRANWNAGEFFTGYLDEMMIMNRALTPQEAVSLYNSGYAQNVAPAKQNKVNITDLVNYALSNGVDTVTDSEAAVPAGSYRTTRPAKVLNDVIFYATEYNQSEYNYDYYAVTHEGGLAKVTDLGSEIMWKDPRSIKWDLIVYTSTQSAEDGSEVIVPSGYYELAYTDADGTTHYLAPQLNTSSLIQGDPLGLQFAGVTAGTHGTTIEAWDADDIEYAGIQIQHEGLTAVTGRASEEFFFARNTELVNYTEPRPVATIDSAKKGIQISLFDYNGGKNGARPDWMEDLFDDGVYRYGHQVTLDLVKHNLDNGVPVASKTNTTLTELFGGDTDHVDAIYNDVNHLFLQGTYDETGYFSYNSAQNYAYYNNDGNFIVYDQAAAPQGTGSANYHGNFFPYNTFGEASTAQYMWYDVNDTLLTPDDPEYGTALRSLSGINYTFGMELATDFYMTKTGLDERGRDIVYEFNGDDDLWVFIDDKLALDIGGVHGAIHGTINFTTGEIVVASEKLYSVTGETSTKDTTVPGSIHTTLADQFRLAYKEQGKTDAEITVILDSTFNKDSNGRYTSFKPYTMHNMKMFYMESGMGASNLNIRFNLPVIPPASFAIEKDLPETVQADYTDRRFAFKVYVEDQYNSGNYVQITQDQVGEEKLIRSAVYENTTTPAVFENGILYLRPDEAIQLTVSDERLKYYVQEVEIDPDMWDEVDINHAPTTMIVDGTDDTLRYAGSDPQAVNQRTRVVFDNVPKNVQKLLINKVVESDDLQSVDPNLTYEFYVYLEGHSGNLEAYSVGEYYLTKTISGVKHYFNNAYTDLGTEPQICSHSGQYGSIGNIRAGYTIEIHGLLPGTDFYVVEREDRIPDGYMFIRKTLTDDTYDAADAGIYLMQSGGNLAPDAKIKTGADAEVTIVNGDMTVHLFKVDATDTSTPLRKAQFTLKKLDPEGYGTYASGSEKVEKTSADTGEDGRTRIAGIKNGYYEISETGIPDGYIMVDEGKFYIKVQNRNITLLSKDNSKKVKEWAERVLTDQDKLSFNSETNTFTIGNTPGAALPDTGGPGTRRIYLLGFLLTGLAAAGLAADLVMRKLRRRH